MAKQATAQDRGPLATSDDIRRMFFRRDKAARYHGVASYHPRRRGASVWLAGNTDIFGAGQRLKPVAGEIVAILTAEEEEEPRPAS
jgi:hypothetical protein